MEVPGDTSPVRLRLPCSLWAVTDMRKIGLSAICRVASHFAMKRCRTVPYKD